MTRTGPRAERAALRALATRWGVQTAYIDASKRRQVASPESLAAALAALGAPLNGPAEAPEALRAWQADEAARWCPLTLVAPDGHLPTFEVRLRSAPSPGRASAAVDLETGQTVPATVTAPKGPPAKTGSGARLRCRTERPLPAGVHQLRLKLERYESSITVLSAPRRCWRGGHERTLGVFLPLHALHSSRSWGIGDLDDLAQLAAWARSLGADLLGVLPLLAGFLDEPLDPSPYSPVTRLFWNELYLDPAGAPDLDRCPEARRRLAAPDLQQELDDLRKLEEVDYRRAMNAKRHVLEALADAAFADRDRRTEIESWARREPYLEDYARFRATVERRGETWPSWPARLRDGTLRSGDYDEPGRRYHLYVQWLWQHQFTARFGAGGDGLYLDLPIGVHRGGFDVWRFQDQFAGGFTVGAPPDPLSAGGQDWGFPPLHPQRSRETGHACFRAAVRNHMRHAAMLRLDHVMGLHRLFWIPPGAEARDGVYVRYPCRELYAILAMESHRNHARVVGENLGTVQKSVNEALRRFGLLPMRIGQFEFSDDPRRAVPDLPPGVLAALNTHDMPPFAAFWEGDDIELRRSLDLLDEAGAEAEETGRAATRAGVTGFLRRHGQPADDGGSTTAAVLATLLGRMSAGDAEVVMVQLEDLWLEHRPQNMPGVGEAFPSWRRRATRSLESIGNDRKLARQLGELARSRAAKDATS